MDWYNFEKNAKILEIGKDFDEENYNSKKFDYIIIKDDISKLDFAKEHLNDNGTILLMLNNRFGIRYFAGDNRDFKPFSTIYTGNTNLYGKKEIEKILESKELTNYKFFYPLPDYENPSAIFSDDYLPEYTNTKLLYTNEYIENEARVFNEVQAIKQITKAGEFTTFANSYIIEINPKTKLRFIGFNDARQEKYRLITKIYDNYVEKIPANDKAKKHILSLQKNIDELKSCGIGIIDSFENGKIVSKYVNSKTLLTSIVECVEKRDIGKAFDLIQKWYDFLKSKFEPQKTKKLNKNIKDENNLASGLTIVKKAYIDLVFENAFMENDEFIFFDQEWCMNDLPLEFILYRAISNMYSYSFEIAAIIQKDEFFKKFGIYSYLPLFKEIEIYIQKEIIESKTKEESIIGKIANKLRGLIGK